MPQAKTYPNRLGLKGWLVGGRWGIERYLFTLHRISGLGILLYFLLHIVVTTTRAINQTWWDGTMGVLSGPVFVVGEYLVFAAFAFHAANGIRLVLIELGILTGKAEEPIYPYRTSLNVQRPYMIILMVIVAVVVLVGGYDFFFMAH